jgi:hypothetical protein
VIFADANLESCPRSQRGMRAFYPGDGLANMVPTLTQVRFHGR